MNGSIDRLQCHYRVLGAPDAAARAALRLDRLAHDCLALGLSAALDGAIADDQAVYVLRRVRARVGLRLDARATDETLARRWSKGLATAVAEAILRDPGAGNLVRFADQADFVSQFVRDLLAGRAWGCWYYGPFAALRPLGTAGAIRAAMLENHALLPAILGRLHRTAALAAALAAVGEAGASELWQAGLEAASGAGAAQRPIFAAALTFAGHLGLRAPVSDDDEQLFAAYLASGTPPADWRDRRGLAVSLLDALRFLLTQGRLRPRALDLVQLDAALAALDWLDTGWLRPALAELLGTEVGAPAPGGWGELPMPGLAGRSPEVGVAPARRDKPARARELLDALLTCVLAAIDRQGLWAAERPAREPLLAALMAAITQPFELADDPAELSLVIDRIVAALAEMGLLRPLGQEQRTRLLDGIEAELAGLVAGESSSGEMSAAGKHSHLRAALSGDVPEGCGPDDPAEAADTSGDDPSGRTIVAQRCGLHPSSCILHPCTRGDPVLAALVVDILDQIERLGLWAGAPVAATIATLRLFEGQAAALPAGGERRAVARALLDLLVGDGLLCPLAPAERERLFEALASAEPGEVGLDVKPDEAASPEGLHGALPPRPTGLGPTPRQRELLGDLRRAAAEVGLDAGAPASAANALQLYAALVTLAPRWAGDPLATGTIRRLLEALAQIERAAAPEGLLRQLQVSAGQAAAPGDPHAALALLSAFGAPGHELVLVLRQRMRATPRRARPAPDHARPGVAVETGCAGCFLLLRAALDARLPALAARTGVGQAASPALGALLVALGLRWAGPTGLAGGELDPGLALLAGLAGEPQLDSLAAILAASDLATFQGALLETLDSLRVLDSAEAHLYAVPLPGGGAGLVLGNGGGNLWPIGQALGPGDMMVEAAEALLERWVAATGAASVVLAPEGLLAGARWGALPARIVGVSGEPGALSAGDPAWRYWEGRGQLLGALEALWSSWPGQPDAALPLTLAAGALIRLWARWLGRGFAGSSVPYLLANAIRRPGRLLLDERGITLDLAPRPLDAVLQLAHYTDDLELVPWLGARRVRFRIGG